MDVPRAGDAAFARVASAAVVGQISHHQLIAHHIVGVLHLGGEQVRAGEKLGHLQSQRTVFEHFRRLDVSGKKFRIARHVSPALFIEPHGLLTEHHIVVTVRAADEERQQRFNRGQMRDDVGDSLVGEDGGDLIVVGHNFWWLNCVCEIVGRETSKTRCGIAQEIVRYFWVTENYREFDCGKHPENFLTLFSPNVEQARVRRENQFCRG